jgi:hypothetical protein
MGRMGFVPMWMPEGGWGELGKLEEPLGLPRYNRFDVLTIHNKTGQNEISVPEVTMTFGGGGTQVLTQVEVNKDDPRTHRVAAAENDVVKIEIEWVTTGGAAKTYKIEPPVMGGLKPRIVGAEVELLDESANGWAAYYPMVALA